MENFAAINFETANGKLTSVYSIGVVIVRGGKIVDKIYRMIRPAPNYYIQWMTKIHGLTYKKDSMETEFQSIKTYPNRYRACCDLLSKLVSFL